MEKMNLSGNKFKGTRMGTKFSSLKDFTYPFPWTHRTYKCRFCQKEFQSAQALGGHMNVHRRDRAEMRFGHSWDNNSHKQNPKVNPNISTVSSPPQCSPLDHQFASPFSGSTDEKKLPIVANPVMHQAKLNEAASLHHLGELKGFAKRRSDFTVWEEKDAKEDLDLELRLGYC